MLKFPFAIAHFNRHLLLFPNLVWNLYYRSHVTGYYAIYYMAPKHPIQLNDGEICYIGLVLAILLCQNFHELAFFSIIVFSESCSTCIILGKWLRKRTWDRRYTTIILILNSFSIEMYGTCLFQLSFMPWRKYSKCPQKLVHMLSNPAVQKVWGPQEGHCEKYEIQGGGQEMAVMVG